MRNENLNLNKIIDFKKWDNLQDYLSLVTKMAIVIVDYKGNPVTKHSRCNKFCELVRADSKLSKYCEKCDSRGGLEAVRMNKPYIYLCHYNIVDVAIPIIIDEKYIGAIMAGQVRIDDYESTDMLEQILKVPDKVLEKNDISNKLNECYNDLPILLYKEVEDTSNMLFLLSNYIVEEALNKNLILEMYEKTMKNGIEIDSKTFNGYSIKNIENVKKEISNAIVNRYITYDYKQDTEEINVSKTLKPAIEYIYNNKSENISMDKMAKICHVSPSYFSRLFSKEIGENFSSYISKLKIKWAKALLEETDMTINEISDELGFSESGYFIKIFKKYEGVTPYIYKKHLR